MSGRRSVLLAAVAAALAAGGCGDDVNVETPPSVAAATAPEVEANPEADFLIAIDDLAIRLDEEIAAAIDTGDGSGVGVVRSEIRDAINDHLLQGGQAHRRANLVLSAATSAREAARERDLPRLAASRRELAEARATP